MSDPAHGEARPRVRCDNCMFWSFKLRQTTQDEGSTIVMATCQNERSPFTMRMNPGWNACVCWQRGEPKDKPRETRATETAAA